MGPRSRAPSARPRPPACGLAVRLPGASSRGLGGLGVGWGEEGQTNAPSEPPPGHSRAGCRAGRRRDKGDRERVGFVRGVMERRATGPGPDSAPRDALHPDPQTARIPYLWDPRRPHLFPGPHPLPRPGARTSGAPAPSGPLPAPPGPRDPHTPDPVHGPDRRIPGIPLPEPRTPRTAHSRTPAPAPHSARTRPAAPGGGPRTHPAGAAAGRARAAASAPCREQLRGRGPAPGAGALPAALRPPRSP